MSGFRWGLGWPERASWIVGLSTTIGLASQSSASWIVDALVRTGGLDVQQAALMSTAEMLAIGVAMIVLAPAIHRLPHKRLILAAVAVLLAAQVLSSSVQGFVPMGLTRILSGTAFGAIYAVAANSGAAAAVPERAYATGASINMLLGMMLNPPVGYGSEHFGHRGVFIALAGYCLVLALPLALIPFQTQPRARMAAAQPAAATSPAPRGLEWMKVFSVVACMGLFAIATNGVYVFFVAIAGRAGLAGTALGEDLVLVSMGAAIGVAALSRLGNRLGPRLGGRNGPVGRVLPVAVSMAAMGAVSWLFMSAPTPFLFDLEFSLWCTVYWIAYTFILGLAVAVDPLGRVAAATGSALILFGGMGSAVAGFVAANFGSSAYGTFAFAACLAGGLLGVMVAAASRTGQHDDRPDIRTTESTP